MLLTPERTYKRKMREVLLRGGSSRSSPKDEILELYLNHIYFGHGRYGIEEAARYYFGKRVARGHVAEAALLAGVVKGPSIYSPRVDLSALERGATFVLEQMVAKGFVTRRAGEAAKNEPSRSRRSVEARRARARGRRRGEAQLRALSAPAAERGGFTVTTTIDPALQTAARAARAREPRRVRQAPASSLAPLTRKGKKGASPRRSRARPSSSAQGLHRRGHRRRRRARHGRRPRRHDRRLVNIADDERYNPEDLAPSEFAEVGRRVRVSLRSGPSRETARPPRRTTGGELAAAGAARAAKLRLELGPECALVALDVRTREVLALVGNYEAVRGGLDRATQSRRQPGSTFKPFVYCYALHARTLTPATLVETNPRRAARLQARQLRRERGQSTKRLREALAHSVNVAAVWTSNTY